MTKRLLISADNELREEIAILLGPGEKSPGATRLERWRQGEYIPCTRQGHGPGSSLTYPPGTAEQVVALMRALLDKCSLDRVALRLFFAPESYRMGAKALRPAVLAELTRVRNYMERQAGTWRGLGERRPPAKLTAARLAEKAARGRLSKQTRPQRDAQLKRLAQPSWLPDDPPEDTLEIVYYWLCCSFLTGRWPPYLEDVLYQALVASGAQKALADMRPAGVKTGQMDSLRQEIVSGSVTAPLLSSLSLPHLAKVVRTMDTPDFEQARKDYPVVNLWLCMTRASGGLAREVVVGLSSLGGVNRPNIAAIFLPVLCEARRSTPEQLDADLPVARELQQSLAQDAGDEDQQAILAGYWSEKLGELFQGSS